MLAKFLEPQELGLYGLIVAAIAYILYFLGFEFYTYSMRELIPALPDLQSNILRNQFIFYLFTYSLVFPLVSVIFFQEILPWEFLGFFLLLLALEHIAQELNRILVAFSLQLRASIILFFRSGVWGLILIFMMWVNPSFRNIHLVLWAWTFGAAVACIGGLWCLRNKFRTSDLGPIDWVWMKRGIRIAFPLLLAALAVRGLFTFDKYWVEAVGGLEILGVYVLYAGFGNSVIAFLDAGVVVFYYQRLVVLSRNNRSHEFELAMAELRGKIILGTSFLVVLAFCFGYFAFGWIGKSIYLDNLEIFGLILIGIFIYGLSHTSHLGLYALGKDHAIMMSQIFALLVFLLVVSFFSRSVGLLVVPVALLISFAVMYACKNYYFKLAFKTFSENFETTLVLKK